MLYDYIYMHVWNDVVIGTQNYVYTCLHPLVNKSPAWFPSGPWRGRRFFISKQSTLDQDPSLPWPPWSRSFIRRRRWKEEVCDSVWPKQLTSRPFILAVLPFVLSSCIGRTILAAWTAWTEMESLRKSQILWVQLLDTDVIQTFPTWKLLRR